MRFSFRRGIQGCAWRAELGFRFGCVCPQVPPRLCSLTTDVHHLRPHLTQDDGQGSSEKYKWGCLSIKVPEGFLGRPMFWGVQRSHWGQLYMPWVVSWNYNVNATDFLSLLFRIPPWSGWSIKTPIILQSYPSSPPPHPSSSGRENLTLIPWAPGLGLCERDTLRDAKVCLDRKPSERRGYAKLSRTAFG